MVFRLKLERGKDFDLASNYSFGRGKAYYKRQLQRDFNNLDDIIKEISDTNVRIYIKKQPTVTDPGIICATGLVKPQPGDNWKEEWYSKLEFFIVKYIDVTR